MDAIKDELQKYFPFCPHCGHKTVLGDIHGTIEMTCPSCHFVFWLNSKPTASCLLLNSSGNVLLARRGIAPHKNDWDAFGGFLEFGEDPRDGVRREIQEELGITLPDIHFLGIYLDTYATTPPQSTLNIYYTCEIDESLKLRPADDVTEARWFSLDELPKNIAFRNNREALKDLKKKSGN